MLFISLPRHSGVCQSLKYRTVSDMLAWYRIYVGQEVLFDEEENLPLNDLINVDVDVITNKILSDEDNKDKNDESVSTVKEALGDKTVINI